MSSHYYLCCERTGECVEAVAYVGKWCGPRIEANALQAFLVYHLRMASDAPLAMRELESFVGDGRSLVSSLEEAAEELESIGTFHGYKPPVMVWTEKNYRSLASRAAGLVEALDDYQHAPGGGVWVRRTDEGRII